MNQCKNCGHSQCALAAALTLLAAAEIKKPMAVFTTSNAPQGEREVAAAQHGKVFTLKFIGGNGGDIGNLANLFINTDLFNADARRVPLFSIAEPTAVNGKDEIPPGTFMADIDDFTAPDLLKILGGAELMAEFFDPLAGFEQAQAKGVMVMNPVNDNGAVTLGTNDVVVDNGVALKNADPAWAKARGAMFGGNSIDLLLADETMGFRTDGRGATDTNTGWSTAGPLAAREHQAVLA